MYVVSDKEYADKLILEKRLRSFGRYPGLIKNQRASVRGIREINEFHLFLFRFFFLLLRALRPTAVSATLFMEKGIPAI